MATAQVAKARTNEQALRSCAQGTLHCAPQRIVVMPEAKGGLLHVAQLYGLWPTCGEFGKRLARCFQQHGSAQRKAAKSCPSRLPARKLQTTLTARIAERCNGQPSEGSI
jgi:hypothetical protein